MHAKGKGQVDLDDLDEDSPYHEFFKRFGGGMPNGPRMMPQRPSQGMGSGFIVSNDGFIVTNAHVVDGASEVTVKLTDRREFTAKVLGADKRTDIALIKIEAKNLPALDFAPSTSVKRGEWVIAIGSPFGFENSVSAGVVSGVHRALPNGQMVPFIQTDVAVNPGNSGGPLLNAKGQVVGVNSQIYSRSGGYMGLSFAIPTDVAVRVAEQIKTHGKVMHGRLGIGIQGLDQSLAQSFGLADANGALVGSVEKDSPAAKAGFKTGDVIRKIDGVAVGDSTDVTSRIGNTAPGTKVLVEVWRDGKPVELTAQIGTLGRRQGRVGQGRRGHQGQARCRRASADAGREEGWREVGARRREGGRRGGEGRRAARRCDRRRRYGEGEHRGRAEVAGRQVGQDGRPSHRAPGPPDLSARADRVNRSGLGCDSLAVQSPAARQAEGRGRIPRPSFYPVTPRWRARPTRRSALSDARRGYARRARACPGLRAAEASIASGPVARGLCGHCEPLIRC